MPTAPVRSTCVPPHADRSKPSMSISRSRPSRAGSLRSGRRSASSAVTKRMTTGRSSQTTRFASASAAAISLGAISRDRSIVQAADAQVEADGARGEEPVEGRRQQVLAGVLLHVIESPRPLNLSVHRLTPARHPAASAATTWITAPSSASMTSTTWRTAPPGWPASRCRRADLRMLDRRRCHPTGRTSRPASLATLDDGRVEGALIRICVVQPMGHGADRPVRRRAARRRRSRRPTRCACSRWCRRTSR